VLLPLTGLVNRTPGFELRMGRRLLTDPGTVLERPAAGPSAARPGATRGPGPLTRNLGSVTYHTNLTDTTEDTPPGYNPPVWRYRLAGSVLGQVFRLWRSTMRIEARGLHWLDEIQRAPLALWHGRMQGVGFALRGRRITSMASNSADGEIATRIFNALGVGIVRGSTHRGGLRGLAALLRVAREGRADHVALTVDGPRGPARVVKSGVVEIARRLGTPVIPATFSATPYWMLKSWDRMVLGRPFGRIVAVFGPPVEIPGDAPLRVAAAAVGDALNRLTDELDTEVAGRPLWR